MLDMEELAVILVFISVFTLFYLINTKRSSSNLPPGPRGLPLVGNLLQIAGKDLRQVFKEYRRKYGPIFTVSVFNKVFIVVNGYENLKDIFVNHGAIFSERPPSSKLGMSPLWKGIGIISAKGEIWKHNRRFALHALRDFGMGKCLMQEKINEEISIFLEAIDEHNGSPFDIKNLVHMAVSNVISSIMFGRRFDYEDTEFLTYLHNLDRVTRTSQVFVPTWLRHIPGDPFEVRRRLESLRQLIAFYTAKVRQHLESFDENETSDLIDAYIRDMKKELDTGEQSLKNENELVRIVHDLFIAGSDTTATTLRFALIYLIRNPDVQTKVFQELEDVIPSDRPAEINDKKQLPYTSATITEILRLSSIAPFGLPHAVKTDTCYRGYTLPASALILPNLESVAMGDLQWDNPSCFDPSRFLHQDTSSVKTEQIIPFSLGPRVCAGEGLARMEIFLFLTAMIRRFEFVIPEGQKPPDCTGKFSTVVGPKPFEVRAIRRDK